jgi:3,4-dihydroxy 2-butanone 4-phosphate synthase/GTP cyclohydrolase II
VLPTAHGSWRAIGYEDALTHQVHMALVLGDIDGDEPVTVRVHSECLTGDVFGSQRCDCQAQLHKAMAMIADAGSGVVVYLRQEGRGIGLMDKLHAYALQDRGLDTVEANERLGLPADKRDYGIGAQILADLGVHRIRAISNNPRKWSGLRGHGLEVVDQLPLTTTPTPHNLRYLRTKRDKLGHVLDHLEDDPLDAAASAES